MKSNRFFENKALDALKASAKNNSAFDELLRSSTKNHNVFDTFSSSTQDYIRKQLRKKKESNNPQSKPYESKTKNTPYTQQEARAPYKPYKPYNTPYTPHTKNTKHEHIITPKISPTQIVEIRTKKFTLQILWHAKDGENFTRENMARLRELGDKYWEFCLNMCELINFATEEEQKIKFEYFKLKESIFGYV